MKKTLKSRFKELEKVNAALRERIALEEGKGLVTHLREFLGVTDLEGQVTDLEMRLEDADSQISNLESQVVDVQRLAEDLKGNGGGE